MAEPKRRSSRTRIVVTARVSKLELASPLSATASAMEKRNADELIIASRRKEKPAEVEIWTDGSVGRIPLESKKVLHDRERVSVQWEDGWCTETLVKFDRPLHSENQEVRLFQTRHCHYPSIILRYDDGDQHAYATVGSADEHDQIVKVLDEDGDVLNMFRSIPKSRRPGSTRKR